MSDTTQEKQATADVSSQRVARVYAEALLNAAETHGQGDAILEELDSLIHDIFKAQAQIEQLLSGAAVGRLRRKDLILKAFSGTASELFVNFLQVLNDHERLGLLRPILVVLRDLYDHRAGRRRVQVVTAVPLAADQHAHLIQVLRANMQLEPVLQAQVDPTLLGGLKLRVGDLQVDATVRTELETIRSEILERSSHEIQSRRDRFCTPNGN